LSGLPFFGLSAGILGAGMGGISPEDAPHYSAGVGGRRSQVVSSPRRERMRLVPVRAHLSIRSDICAPRGRAPHRPAASACPWGLIDAAPLEAATHDLNSP